MKTMSKRGDIPITCYGSKYCQRAWLGKTHCDPNVNICRSRPIISVPKTQENPGEHEEKKTAGNSSLLYSLLIAFFLFLIAFLVFKLMK